MAFARLVVCLFLLAAWVGCTGSYYKQHLGSHLPRADGSTLDVNCYSSVKHTVSSISPTLGNEPAITVVLDQRIFVVTADTVSLNEQPYAVVPRDAEEVRIQITEEGCEVRIDGIAAELLRAADPTDEPAV